MPAAGHVDGCILLTPRRCAMSDRWDRFTWDERLLLEDACACYEGEYRNSPAYSSLAVVLMGELRDTLNEEDDE
jgi:hypothetical protein